MSGWTRRVRPSVVVVVWVVACGDGVPAGVEEPPCRAAAVPYPVEAEQWGATADAHDPEIVREGNAYYVYSTNDGIQIRRSPDLLQWSFVGRVFEDQLPGWASGEVPGVEAPWAPGIGRFNGRYHLYYSLSRFGSPRSVIGLATNETLDPEAPGYEWQDRGKVVESFDGWDYNAIDAAVVEDAEGGLWLAWGSWGGGIKLRALDPTTGLLAESGPTQYSLARRPVERAVEAPYIVRRGADYYLFVSFDLCCRGVESTYSVRVGRAADVTGPYMDRHGMPMTEGGGSPVLEGYGRFRGPGHASVLEEGGEYLLAHHYYDADAGGTPRLQVRPLLWDDEGWPLAGFAYDGTAPGPPPETVSVAGRWGYWLGSAGASEVVLEPGGSARACDGAGRWSYDAPMLTVEWDSIGVGGGRRTDRSVLAGDGDSLVGRSGEGGLVRGYRLPLSD